MSNAEFPHLSHEEDDDLAVGRREGRRDGRTDGVKWSLDLMEESGDGRRVSKHVESSVELMNFQG